MGLEDYNTGYCGMNQAGINDVLISVGLPITYMQNHTITPMINHGAMVGSGPRDSVENDSNYQAGIPITFCLSKTPDRPLKNSAGAQANHHVGPAE